MKARTAALPWFNSEHYLHLKVLMTDGDTLPATHETWAMTARQLESLLSLRGTSVVRVRLVPCEFDAWCHARSLEPNAMARQLFANEFVGRSTPKNLSRRRGRRARRD